MKTNFVLNSDQRMLNTLEMEQFAAGTEQASGCVTGKVNGVITGFCTIGSFLNPFVAVGCAGYGIYEYFAC